MYQEVTKDMKKKRAVYLHHPFFRNCTYTVEIPNSPYSEPYPCGLCNQFHMFKTYHFNLNENGDVCVAQAVWDYMKELDIGGDLKATREVMPLPTVLNLGNQPVIGQYTIISREHGTYGQPIIIAGEGETRPSGGLVVPPQPGTPRISQAPSTPEEEPND